MQSHSWDVTSSLPRTPRHPPIMSHSPMKRAPVVYGKRSNATVAHSPTLHSLSPSVHASDTEPHDAADTFQFSFRHRLKQLDDEFDDRDAQSPSREAAGPSQVKDLQSVSMGTTILSSEARPSSAALSPPSLSPPSASFQVSSAQEHPPGSPLVQRRTRRVSSPVSSDSEAEEPNKSSSVSPVRHAITTPHSRSSPTPPTSADFPMVSRKTKGKAPARDVLPLVFDNEQPLGTEPPTKSSKRRQSEPLVRHKTKVQVLNRIYF